MAAQDRSKGTKPHFSNHGRTAYSDSTKAVKTVIDENGKLKNVRVRCTAREICDQTDIVKELITKGKTAHWIRRFMADEHGLTKAQTEDRMRNARREMLEDLSTITRQEAAAKMVNQLDELLELARDNKQLSNAIGALRLQAELMGLQQRSN